MKFTYVLEEYYEQLTRQLKAKRISQEKYNRCVDKLMDWEENYYDLLEERQ